MALDGYLGTGSYQYIIQYEYPDNAGKISRSTTSEIQTIAFPSGTHNAVKLTLPTNRLSTKKGARGPIRYGIYRTEANRRTFYRVTSILDPTTNDPSVDSIDYIDTLADGYLISRERINIDGEVLDSDAPPPCDIIATYKNRIWVNDSFDRQQLFYSQTIIPGEPVCFSQLLTVRTDPRGGKITAIAPMDDHLVIYKEGAVFRLAGDGPDNLGLSGFYSDPQLVTTDVGCTNPNSVAMTPNGLVFQSAKGIMLLDRGWNVQYIGAPVFKYNDLRISSTTVVSSQNVVVFTTEGSSIALVWNYFENQWATWTNHQAVDSDVFEGKLCLLRSNGKVFQQNFEKFTDGSDFYPLKLRTAFLSAADLQGFQRVNSAALLGEFKGPHTLMAAVSYDYNDEPSETVAIDAAALFNSNVWGDSEVWGSDEVWGGEYTPYQFILPALARQKCQAISFEIWDTQSSGFNEGYSISGLTLKVGVKSGLNKVPARNKVG